MNNLEIAHLDRFDLDTWLLPYWNGNITYHESVMFIGEDGAPLLYAPEKILSVRSFDLKNEYKDGVDYEVRDGKIFRLEGSAIPYFTWDQFYPAKAEDSVTGSAFKGTSRPFVFFAEGTYFHQRQVFVTYTHKENTELYVPQKGEKLYKFAEKLERGGEFNLVFFGDSITAGANASGRENTLPGTPLWAQMVAASFEKKYPKSKINYINTAVGGKDTTWGLSELEERVNAYSPDLVILGFGMNDGSRNEETFRDGAKALIDGILAKNPDCEIATIATMLPHKETAYWGPQHLWEGVLTELVKEYSCVEVVPMTSVHSSLLTKKRYFDMTGNNVNHPNDFLIRVYAQTVLRRLGAE